MGEIALLLTRSSDEAAVERLASRIPGRVTVARIRASGEESRGAVRLPPPTDGKLRRVYLHDFPGHAPMPGGILAELLNCRVLSVEHVDERAPPRRYWPFGAVLGSASVLNVIPGAGLPLDRGVNRRIFELTLHLNESGIPTELLVGALGRGRRSRLSALLTAIAPAVHS